MEFESLKYCLLLLDLKKHFRPVILALTCSVAFLPAHQELDHVQYISDSLVNLYPDSARLHLDKGEWHRLHEEYGRAELSYNLAETLEPGLQDLHLARAHWYYDQLKYAPALAYVDSFLEGDTMKTDVLMFRGKILLKLNRKQDARNTFELAIKTHRNPPPNLFYRLVDLNLRLGDTLAAYHWVNRGTQKLGNIETLHQKGFELEMTCECIPDRFMKAANRIDRQYANRKNKVPGYLKKARLFQAAGQNKKATAEARKALNAISNLHPRLKSTREYSRLRDSLQTLVKNTP